MKDRTIDELKAADEFRQSLLQRADGDRSGEPVWEGWAVMEAFLAGMDYGRRAISGGAGLATLVPGL